MESRDEDVLDEYYESYIRDCDYYGIDFDKCASFFYYIIFYQ